MTFSYIIWSDEIFWWKKEMEWAEKEMEWAKKEMEWAKKENEKEKINIYVWIDKNNWENYSVCNTFGLMCALSFARMNIFLKNEKDIV